MIEVAVTDTHGLIWYAQSRWRKLGPEARKIYVRADEGAAAIYIPTVVLVELSEAAHRGAIQLLGGFDVWVSQLLDSGNFVVVDLDLQIILRAESLYAIPERGDRLIAATAAHMGYPLLTRDAEVGRVAGVRVVW